MSHPIRTTNFTSAKLAALFLVTVSWQASAQAGSNTWTIESSTSKAGFIAIGSPGFLRITGEGAKVTGTAQSVKNAGQSDTVTGQFEVNLSDLTTGMSLRDKHMKTKYLETDKFPKATLVINELTLPPNSEGQGKLPFKGLLTLKGVTKPVEGEARLTQKSDTLAVEAKFTLNLANYTVGVPSWLGVTVAETVEVDVAFSARPGSTP